MMAIVTKEDLAERLNGREYGNEVEQKDEIDAKESGLVIVFGCSGDNAEFRGAMHDEVGCYNGRKFTIDRYGIRSGDWSEFLENDPDEEDARLFFERKQLPSVALAANWCDAGMTAWTYGVDFPHATFDIMEDGEVWCRGIVFSLEEVLNQPGESN